MIWIYSRIKIIVYLLVQYGILSDLALHTFVVLNPRIPFNFLTIILDKEKLLLVLLFLFSLLCC